MSASFVLLTEKEEIWAGMLLEVLRDNGIPCTSLPVQGAAFSMRTGTPERLRIFVPEDQLAPARKLAAELFPSEEEEAQQAFTS